MGETVGALGVGVPPCRASCHAREGEGAREGVGTEVGVAKEVPVPTAIPNTEIPPPPAVLVGPTPPLGEGDAALPAGEVE